MAARRVLRLAERQARAARPWPRPPQRIGEWRERRAPLPPRRGQLRRLRENQELVYPQRRALALSRSLEAAERREIPVQTSMNR
ncbi:uncharacterized protein [Chamaea fasciata]|uniref:uncharacterized protein isoform X3 n=1 Tax=Chamaea fasciata TaxID=190680 RepID=UPI003369F079